MSRIGASYLRRKKGEYFDRVPDAPEPLVVRVQGRVSLCQVDIMGVAWHGRYLEYFELGAAELRRRCGLSYEDFYRAKLHAPIVQFHLDYHLPLVLDEEFTVMAMLLWDEGARLNCEYRILKADGRIAATGYSVQMFIDGATGEAQYASPEMLERCRKRWKNGEYGCLQQKPC